MMVKMVITDVPAASAADWCGVVEHVLDVRAALEIDGATQATNQWPVLTTAYADATSIADGTERDGIRRNPLRRLDITGRTVLVRALRALVWRCCMGEWID